jgi:hypothetical protein
MIKRYDKGTEERFRYLFWRMEIPTAPVDDILRSDGI